MSAVVVDWSDPHQWVPFAGSLLASAVGLGLWVAAMFTKDDPIKRRRLFDTGATLVFGAVIVRILAQGGPSLWIDYLLLGLSGFFIVLSLRRILRDDGRGPDGGRR